MPRRKRRITELPTEEVIKKLFPKEAIQLAKSVAHAKDAKPVPKKES